MCLFHQHGYLLFIQPESLELGHVSQVTPSSLCMFFMHLLQAVFQSSLTHLIDVFLLFLLGRALHKQMNVRVRDFPDGSLR